MAEATLAPGGRFGDYEIVSELGGGGMGRVWCARDVTLERLVAIKTLAPQLGGDPAYAERFLREARAAARLNHPSIVQIYGFGSVGSVYYLAMEYVEGASLGRYLRRGPFPEKDAVAIVRHAARALGVAHAHGLVHRDIKPENIMLTPAGVVKIVDLGIAKQLDEEKGLTQTGLVVGTPQYVSPEQVKGERDVDARADVYSLGATLYHLVTGRPPFDGDSGAIVMFKHLVEPLPDPRTIVPELTGGFCRVLARMMAKDRDERYPDMDAVDRDLFRVEEGEEPIELGTGAPPTAAGFTAAATVGRPAAPAAPPATPAGGTAHAAAAGFDSGALARIEEALASDIGPMARVLVRRVARGAPSLEALCDLLADQVPEGASRESFRRRCLSSARPPEKPPTVLRATPGAPATPAPPAAPGPTLGAATPLAITDAEMRHLESELARHVGPLARVLVKKGVRGSRSAAELLSRLEAEIADEKGRRAFRAATRSLDRA